MGKVLGGRSRQMGDQRAFLCGYYGQGNAGDEALLAVLLQMLPAGVQPIVLTGDPRGTYQRFQVETCDRRSGWRLLQALNRADLFIWGGGSLMQDVTSWRSPLYYAGLMALAQQRGLRTIAWAQGLGPLRAGWTRWLARQTLAGCTAISVRDRASAALLASWGLNALLAPDPVWALEPAPLEQEEARLPAPRVAVTLREHPLLTPDRRATLTAALVDFQQATGTTLLLIPFQPRRDRPLAEAIAAQLPGPQAIRSEEDPRRCQGLFAGVELAIGMRLHSLVMAAAAGCRCFALSYDPKVTQLMQELALPGCEVADLPDDAGELSRRWQDCYATAQPLTTEAIAALRDRARQHQDLLRRAIAA